MSSKQKLKSYFKSKEGSEAAVELLRMFILPFSKKLRGRMGVDEMIGHFFAIEDRKFAYVKAKRSFSLPGKYYVTGNRPVYGIGPRSISKGQTLLMAIDRQEGTARVQAVIEGKEHQYLLEKFEFETIKDWVEVINE